MDARPKFRTVKVLNRVDVILQCSNCEKDIRRLKPTEKVKVDRGHYCKKCDDGAVHVNLPEKQ